MRLDQAAKSLFLREFVGAIALSMRYFFKPKATLNYPYEKGPISLAMVAIVAGVLEFTGLGANPSG